MSSDCGQSDFEFSLSGSSVAIDYVLSDYIKNTKRIYELIYSGNKFKTIAAYNASVMSEPNQYAFYNNLTLKKDEEIILSNYSGNEDFYILHKASSFDLPKEINLYVKKGCINLNSVEKIK